MLARFLFAALIFITFSYKSFAQTGSVAGTITDASNNETLIGATVAVENSQSGTVTDIDGSFKIDNLNAGTYSLKISYVGYDSKELTGVEVKPGETNSLNIALGVAQSNTISEIVVTADAAKENISTMLSIRKNNAAVSDIISSDLIKKSPDKNTSEVLKRVSGVTIQDNKFVVVRGMNDRYNEAMLNGALLPSSEADRKTFAFDIFPSAIVDNITVIKTATPDLPGDFSGGLVQVNTKEIPDRNFISVKAGGGYNSISTFKNYYTYPGGKTDWLGIDDGTRALPADFPSHDEFIKLGLQSDARITAAQSLQNNWAYTQQSSSPLNPSFELVGGFKVGNNNYPTFGGVIGTTYNSSHKQLPVERYDYYGYDEGTQGDTIYDYNDTIYMRTILSSALADFGVKINANNKITFNNVYSINSLDLTSLRNGYNFVQPAFVASNSFYFSSNKIYNGQLSGEHFIPKVKLKIKWVGYYTTLNRDEPDYRRNLYYKDDESSPYYAVVSSSPSTNTGGGTQYYGLINDQSKGANLDLGKTFQLFHQVQNFKIGGGYYYDVRNRDARVFSNIISDPGTFNFNYYYATQDTIFAPQHFDAQTGFTLYEDKTPTNHYDGSNQNTAGYAMFDNKFTEVIRFVWGARLERYHQVLNTFDQNNDSLRIDTVYNDLLPSANLIISILKDANLRLSFSQSVARPSYRELANAPFYDFVQNITFYGNPALVETHINNFDLRWEHFFTNTQYYSVSGFYKTFTDPIEQKNSFPGTDSKSLQFVNAPKATDVGLELEARKNFGFISKGFENLFVYFNLAYIKSKVNSDKIESPDSSTTRPLQGQSPVVLNASLLYTEPKTKLNASLLFNYIGDRLFLVGTLSDEPTWQKTHPALDLKLSKSFLKNGLVEVTWGDILHGNDVLYYDLNRDGKFEATPRGTYSKSDRTVMLQHYGTNLSLALSYKF